jgi:hypothetical protein
MCGLVLHARANVDVHGHTADRNQGAEISKEVGE